MKVHFSASESPEAQRALEELSRVHPHVPLAEADVVVALGGDGAMLSAIRRHLHHPIPVYGMNRGHLGFLMNRFYPDQLIERIERADEIIIHPLRMRAHCHGGDYHDAFAINEVALLRQTHQAAKLRVFVDEIERLGEIICDGVMVATPAGSTAYNLSAHGPILPLGSNLIALTPISPFRPRRWRGALLRDQAAVRIEVYDPLRRPVSVSADAFEVRDVERVEVSVAHELSCRLLFDREEGGLEARTMREQFT